MRASKDDASTPSTGHCPLTALLARCPERVCNVPVVAVVRWPGKHRRSVPNPSLSQKPLSLSGGECNRRLLHNASTSGVNISMSFETAI